MLHCPRCQRLVDERAASVCPHCAAPLNTLAAQASPSSPPAENARRTVRVSLTGEVLEEAPTSAPASNTAYAAPAAGTLPSIGRPLSPASVRPSPSSSRRESAPDGGGSKALLLNLGALFLFVAVCVGGGGWYWTHRTNPRAQVTRYLHAVQVLDWGVVYDLSATPPGNKSRHEFLSMMDDKFDNNGLYKIGARKSLEKITFTVGEPVIAGSEATVAVTRSAAAFSAAKSLPLTLTNYGGVWKIHPLGENPLDMMHDPDADKKAAENLLRSLLRGNSGASGTGSSGIGGQPAQR